MLNLPNFMIIGAMKSATSTLQDQLVQQPGLYMCNPKEPNYFSDDIEYAKGLSWYSSFFADFPVGALMGEASTHYSKLPTYPKTTERIKNKLKDVHFIYVMRHPIDRLISHYIHEWSMGNYKCDINEAINRYSELIEYSRYAMQLEPYISEFGRHSVLPVFFDKLIKDSQSELERVCTFIGYESEVKWRTNIQANNVSNKRIRKFPLYDFLIESWLAKIIRRNIVPKIIRDYIKSKLRMKARPVITKENIMKLERIFNDDLEIISKWFGEEINCHNFKDVTSSKTISFLMNN